MTEQQTEAPILSILAAGMLLSLAAAFVVAIIWLAGGGSQFGWAALSTLGATVVLFVIACVVTALYDQAHQRPENPPAETGVGWPDFDAEPDAGTIPTFRTEE